MNETNGRNSTQSKDSREQTEVTKIVLQKTQHGFIFYAAMAVLMGGIVCTLIGMFIKFGVPRINEELKLGYLTPKMNVAAPQVSVASPICYVTNQVNMTPEVNVSAPQVSVASPVCYVTNHVSVVPQLNVEGIRDSFALLGSKFVEAESMRIEFEKKRIDDERNEVELRAKERDEESVRYARNAMFYINHINMVLSKIITYNNPAVLEEEYNAISLNSIRLDTIKDVEVIDIIQEIMDYITEMRLQERQRAMLKEELDQGMSDALIDSFKGVSTGGAISPLGMAANLITSAASAGMNYRNAINKLKKEHGKELWKLDNEKIKGLNELNKSLLNNYWKLIQRYGLKDRYRVTEDSISRLFTRLKDDDVDRRYRFLKQNENTYMALPVYWFYRGEAAYKKKQFDDAVYAFMKYQESQKEEDEFVYDSKQNGLNMRGCGKILRRDPTAAKVAMLFAATLLELGEKSKYYTQETFENQIRLIVENTLDDEWSLRYYAAYLCGDVLKDVQGAKNILQKTIDELESRRDVNLVTWADLHQGTSVTSNEDKIIAPGDVIMRCKELLLEMEARKRSPAGVEEDCTQEELDNLMRERDNLMRELCEREGTSAREKLFMYGAMRYKDALSYLKKDLEGITATRVSNGDIDVAFPMSWIVNREGNMKVFLLQEQPSFECGESFLGNERYVTFSEKSREIFNDVGQNSSTNKCKVKFSGDKSTFTPQAVLLSVDYDIRDPGDRKSDSSEKPE